MLSPKEPSLVSKQARNGQEVGETDRSFQEYEHLSLPIFSRTIATLFVDSLVLPLSPFEFPLSSRSSSSSFPCPTLPDSVLQLSVSPLIPKSEEPSKDSLLRSRIDYSPVVNLSE